MSGKNSLLLFVFLLCYGTWDVEAVMSLSMEDIVEVYRGQSATIHCLYSFSQPPSMVIVQWFVRDTTGSRVRISYSDPTMHKVDENTAYSDRISVVNDQAGANLSIANVSLFDEREFFCQVDGLAAGSKEGRTLLRIFEIPELPVIEAVHTGISVMSVLPLKIASCETREGYPKPNITWYRNHQQLLPQNAKVNIVTLVTRDNVGLYTVQSDLQYKVVKEDKDAYFSCEISYFVPGAVRMAESRAVNIIVHYPTTSVKIWQESPEGHVKEGDTVEIRCQGDGNPPSPVNFSREQQQQEVNLDSKDGVLVLKDVSRGDGGKYRCRSSEQKDVLGSLQLDVHYLDPAVVVPKDSEVMLKGESLTATCNALSSLETMTEWRKNGVLVGKGHVLQLNNATFDTAGHYDCSVTVRSLPGLHTNGSVHIIVQGAPQLKHATADHMEVKVGKWVNLTCEARGYPRPAVTWSGPSNSGLREVMKNETENLIQSMVTFKVSSDTMVTCNASNILGAETRNYTIKSTTFISTTAQKTTADNSGVIIVVIIVTILLLAILGSVLYFLYKKAKLPCGRSGKQEIINAYSTKEMTNKENIVIEMKAEKMEESVLLKNVNGDKNPSSDQYIDLRK